MSRTVLILREPEIRRLLDPASCRAAVEEAFSAYATGRAALPEVINLDLPEWRGEVHVKAGHGREEPSYAVKTVSGFTDNPERGLPATDGMILVFDAETGAPAALLLDHGAITQLRTGAAGAVAAKHLARVECCRFVAVDSVREAVEGADMVVTVTLSREPLVRAEWIARGTHVTAVGSDEPEKRELFPEVLARADRVVADSREQCLRLGEIHHAVTAGVLAESEVDAELGEITAGLKPGRVRDSEITVCDLTGVGVQDVAS